MDMMQQSAAWAAKVAQMNTSKKSTNKGAKTKAKSDKREQCEAILEDMDAYTLDEQMAAVKYQRKHEAGIFSCLGCGQSEAEETLQVNLMAGIDEANEALNNKDLWGTWMQLYKLMRFAEQMGWEDDAAYVAAQEKAESLELSMDDQMDLDKVEITDPKAIAKIQRMFDACSLPSVDGQTPLNRVVVNKVEQIFHEQTKAEYLLKRQQLVEDLQANPDYERIRVPSQAEHLSSLHEGTAPCEPDYNEFYLFHGTSDTVANLIADSDFLIKSSADNGWTFGKGVYAAEWVSHAQMFAMMGDPTGNVVTILLCRAFVGRCQNAGNWPNTATPCGPPNCKTPAQLEANIQSGAFHSTTGSEWPGSGFKVHDYILPDDDQILPEFICHCTF